MPRIRQRLAHLQGTHAAVLAKQEPHCIPKYYPAVNKTASCLAATPAAFSCAWQETSCSEIAAFSAQHQCIVQDGFLNTCTRATSGRSLAVPRRCSAAAAGRCQCNAACGQACTPLSRHPSHPRQNLSQDSPFSCHSKGALHGSSPAVWAPAAQSSWRVMSRSDGSIALPTTPPCRSQLVNEKRQPLQASPQVPPGWTARAASTLHASLVLFRMRRSVPGLLHHRQVSQQQELPHGSRKTVHPA